LSDTIDKKGEFNMKIDLEKRVSVVDSLDEIIELSKKYLNDDSIKQLKSAFDIYAIFIDDGDESVEIRLIDMINHLIVTIPKRIDRLSDLKAPQSVIDSEKLVLEIVQKIKEDNQK
jgi:hypothetical protein